MQASVHVRLLCFGDSLTEGFYARGTLFHPYSQQLVKLLHAQLPAGSTLQISQQGVSGELVTQTMQPRLQEALQNATNEGRPYDWIILLGGINDIGSNVPYAAVGKGIAALWRAAIAHGSRVLAMTTLEAPCSDPRLAGRPQYGQLEAARLAFNKLIKQRAQEPEFVGAVRLLDMGAQLPQFALDEEQRREWWEPDQLHLTPAGYDRMAQLVAAALAPLLRVQ